MRYAAQRAADPSFSYTPELILALHFMMTEHDRNARPGAWRSNRVQIIDADAEVVYEAPDAERIPSLVQELTDSLNQSNELPPVIRAAIAHLNILRIHPFRDGSGRMARCLQALILSHETILPPEISSMEEYFGQYTLICNEALNSTGARWEPHRDTRKWIRLCLTAHYRQAVTLLRKVGKIENLRRQLTAQESAGGLSEQTLVVLSEMFGATPAAIARWWRMRPGGVVQRITREALGYKLRGRNPNGETPDLVDPAPEVTLLLSSRILDDEGNSLPDPFELLAQAQFPPGVRARDCGLPA